MKLGQEHTYCKAVMDYLGTDLVAEVLGILAMKFDKAAEDSKTLAKAAGKTEGRKAPKSAGKTPKSADRKKK